MKKEKVKEIRNKLGLTKFRFATELNISIDLVISMENGRRNVSRITSEKIADYAKVHGVSIGDK